MRSCNRRLGTSRTRTRHGMSGCVSLACVFSAPAAWADVPGGTPQSTTVTVAPPHVLPNADLYRVNADGFAVGALHENGVNSAVVWNYPRAVQLGTLGGPSSTAYAINDAGTIVGDSQTDRMNEGHIVSQAFVWDAVMHDLSDPDSGLDSAALDVNTFGH